MSSLKVIISNFSLKLSIEILYYNKLLRFEAKIKVARNLEELLKWEKSLHFFKLCFWYAIKIITKHFIIKEYLLYIQK